MRSAVFLLLARRARVNGERMHAASKFGGERLIDQAMAFDPALAPERIRNDMNTEMTLAAGPVAGMPDMVIRLILDPQALRCEGRG